jgi:hypothetical protein
MTFDIFSFPLGKWSYPLRFSGTSIGRKLRHWQAQNAKLKRKAGPQPLSILTIRSVWKEGPWFHLLVHRPQKMAKHLVESIFRLKSPNVLGCWWCISTAAPPGRGVAKHSAQSARVGERSLEPRWPVWGVWWGGSTSFSSVQCAVVSGCTSWDVMIVMSCKDKT